MLAEMVAIASVILTLQVGAVLTDLSADLPVSRQDLSRQTAARHADAMFAEFWQNKLRNDPEFATSVGVHTYNDKLTAQSPSAYLTRQAMLMRYVYQAYAFLPFADEGTQTRLNLQVFITQNILQIDLYRIGNQYLSVSYLEGPHVNMMVLLDFQPLKTSQDFLNLVSRYRAFTQLVDETIALLNVGISRGITQHETSLNNLEKTYSSFAVAANDSLFYDPFKDMSEDIENAEKIRNSARQALSENVAPGFRKLSEYITNVYRKHTRPNIGINTLPNGAEFYRHILNYHATEEVTAEELHQLGLKEVDRISSVMKNVIEKLGFQNMSAPEFNEHLRNDPAFSFNTSEEALNAFKNVIRTKIQPKLPQIFKNIPKAELQIKQMPDHLLGGPLAIYLPGSPDGTSNGTFFVDTSSPKEVKTYILVALSLHEGLPGHHLQVSYTMEQQGIPDFRRFIQPPVNTAFIEGWGLYSEYLGYEMGLYEDSYSMYGHLSQEIFRACRLVVDTGIHAFGWTREQAEKYMLKHSAETPKGVQREVTRYITWPGQACSYKFGELKIKELRKRTETALGANFDLKEFHDIILRSYGPLSFVEQEVDRMISTAQ